MQNSKDLEEGADKHHVAAITVEMKYQSFLDRHQASSSDHLPPMDQHTDLFKPRRADLCCIRPETRHLPLFKPQRAGLKSQFLPILKGIHSLWNFTFINL